MIKRLRTLKAPELRLLLAVCSFVIFFAMAQTTPTGTDGCIGGHDHGKIQVTNNYTADIRINFSGPTPFGLFVEIMSSETSDNLKTGTYTYTANVPQQTESWKGDVVVEKDKTALVTIKQNFQLVFNNHKYRIKVIRI